jgi:hypothetical protein
MNRRRRRLYWQFLPFQLRHHHQHRHRLHRLHRLLYYLLHHHHLRK